MAGVIKAIILKNYEGSYYSSYFGCRYHQL